MTDPKERMGGSRTTVQAPTDSETPIRRSAYRNVHVWGSGCVYLISLAMPGFYELDAPAYGIEVLLWGWLGPLNGHFAWFANPFYLVALVRAPQLKSSIQFSGVAVVLALSFLLYDTIEYGGGPVTIALGPGYFVWVAALALYCGGQVWMAWPVRWK